MGDTVAHFFSLASDLFPGVFFKFDIGLAQMTSVPTTRKTGVNGVIINPQNATHSRADCGG